LNVPLNLNCRDEIVPILAALQYIYSQPRLREQILHAIAGDVNCTTSRQRGREGMDYWQIFVLAAVRLGCDFDYDPAGFSGSSGGAGRQGPSECRFRRLLAGALVFPGEQSGRGESPVDIGLSNTRIIAKVRGAAGVPALVGSTFNSRIHSERCIVGGTDNAGMYLSHCC
jgi:hypothetical protein